MGNENGKMSGRPLREAVTETLLKWGDYSEDDINCVMTVLEKVGVKNVKTLNLIDHSQLEAQGMKPAVASILLHTFGGNPGANDPWWKRMLDFLNEATPVIKNLGAASAHLATAVNTGIETHGLRTNPRARFH